MRDCCSNRLPRSQRVKRTGIGEVCQHRRPGHILRAASFGQHVLDVHSRLQAGRSAAFIRNHADERMKPHAKDAADAKQSWECRTPGSTPDSDHRQEAEGFKKSSCLGDPGSRRVRLLLHRPGQAGTMPLVWGERATRPFSAATCRRVRTHDGRPPFSARVVRPAVGQEELRTASRPGLQRVATKRIFRIPPRLSPPPPAATGDRSRSVRLRHRCVG